MIKEWWSPSELAEAKLPDMPTTREAIALMADAKGWRKPEQEYPKNDKGTWRKRQGRGAGFEYRYDILPLAARTKLMHAQSMATKPTQTNVTDTQSNDLWRFFESLSNKKKAKAEHSLKILNAVEALEISGITLDAAVAMIAAQEKISPRTIYNWRSRIAGVPKSDRLPALCPRNFGRVAEVECDQEAWNFIYADYFRAEAPNFTDCYRRLVQVAADKGWKIPPARTMERRIGAVPVTTRILARDGIEALKRLYPAQNRDKTVFYACEAVNADGHKWDVFVQWPDGQIGRPVMVGFQDLYSGKLLSWRFDRGENKEMVLLAFGDLVQNYGIPKLCWLDNGRSFASKWLTGGTANRYRFKTRDNDPQGVMTALGVEVHWTTPYAGQSKPIERAWRDLAQSIAKHPAFAGAYTGNNPNAKPENYASKAVPFDVFEKIVSEGIREHNARPGRRSAVCAGKLSFDQAFELSFQQNPITQATPEQCRLWLLAAEGVLVRKNAQIDLLGNAYWCPELTEFIGQRVVARFDPDKLHSGIHVYRLDGAYIAEAECIEAVGFADTTAARDHSKARKSWLKATKEQHEAERKLGIEEIAAMLPGVPEKKKPTAKVVRPAAMKPKQKETVSALDDAFARGVAMMHDGQILPFQKKKSDAA